MKDNMKEASAMVLFLCLTPDGRLEVMDGPASPETPCLRLFVPNLTWRDEVRLGFTPDGQLLAVFSENGQVRVGQAKTDPRGRIVFNRVDLVGVPGDNRLAIEVRLSGGLMKQGKYVISFDPLLLVAQMTAVGFGDRTSLHMDIRHGQLVFGTFHHVAGGRLVSLTTLRLADQMYGVVEVTEDSVYAMKLTQDGQTWVADGDIGHVNLVLNAVGKVTVDDLVASGFGDPLPRVVRGGDESWPLGAVHVG